ncbi:hypothetical protein [Myroides sp. DW712]|uniref:hypothetical protein n=1 Tax=Myroides sp. DW712 TaxID=3389800 RepID=UPI00397DCACB
MRKLLLFFMMASLAVLGTACSSDDSKGGSNKELALFSDADEDGIYQGTAVEFTVMAEANGDVVEVEEGVSFYVDGKEVTNPYTFTELGEFKVVAKKKGYKDSNTLIIKVVEGYIVGPEDKGKLTISVVGGVTEVEVDDEVKFEVKDEEGINITTASIELSDGLQVGYRWTPSAPGTYKAFAFKNGYEKSEGVIITVKEKVEKKLVLALEGNPNELYVNERFRLTIKDGQGAAVSNAILYKNEMPTAMTSVNGVFDVTLDAVGTYALKAVQEGVESNGVNVTVKQKQVVANSFSFLGRTYNIAQSTLFFSGIVAIDENETVFAASWQVEAAEAGGKIAIVMFLTAATHNGNGDFSYQRPGPTNTVPYLAGVVQGESTLGFAEDNIDFAFSATTSNGLVYVGRYDAAAADMGGAPFSMNFNGSTNFVNDSSQGIRGAVSAKAGQGNLPVNAGRMVKKTNTLRALSR